MRPTDKKEATGETRIVFKTRRELVAKLSTGEAYRCVPKNKRGLEWPQGDRMSNNSSSPSSGIGFTGLLTIVFIVLKLVGYISWSWWWVLSPVWIVAAVVLIILSGGVLVAVVTTREGR